MNYKMNILCGNCTTWEAFDIPFGVEAIKITEKRKCKFCGCSFKGIKPMTDESKKLVNQMVKELLTNIVKKNEDLQT